MNPLYEGCTIISYQNILQCIAMKLNSFLRKAIELCFVLYTCHNHDTCYFVHISQMSFKHSVNLVCVMFYRRHFNTLHIVFILSNWCEPVS